MKWKKVYPYLLAGMTILVTFMIGSGNINRTALAKMQDPYFQPNRTIQPITISSNSQTYNFDKGTINSSLDESVVTKSFPVMTEQNILQEINRYKELEAVFTMQPGWTYLSFDQFDFLPLNSPKPLPAKYQKEFWSHFDQNGKVYEQVDYVISPETGKVPLGVFSDGEMVSRWNADQSVKKEPYTPSYDLYLASSIQGLIENGISHKLSMEKIKWNDSLTTVVELQTQYTDKDQEWFNLNLGKPVWGQLEQFYFDSQTGLLLRYEHAYVLEDMSLVPSSVTDNFHYVPNVEPPLNVINLLTERK